MNKQIITGVALCSTVLLLAQRGDVAVNEESGRVVEMISIEGQGNEVNAMEQAGIERRPGENDRDFIRRAMREGTGEEINEVLSGFDAATIAAALGGDAMDPQREPSSMEVMVVEQPPASGGVAEATVAPEPASVVVMEASGEQPQPHLNKEVVVEAKRSPTPTQFEIVVVDESKPNPAVEVNEGVVLPRVQTPGPKHRNGSGDWLDFEIVSITESTKSLFEMSQEEAETFFMGLPEPEAPIPFRGVSLDKAIQGLAETMGMQYVAPGPEEFDDLVTMRVKRNPFAVLKMLADTYDFEIDFHQGIWRFYRVNPGELVTRTYRLRYNDLANIEISSPSLNSTLNASTSGGIGMGAGGGGGLDTGGGSDTFSIETDRLVEDIMDIMGIEVTGMSSNFSEGGSVGDFSSMQGTAYAYKGRAVEAPDGQVKYIADTNSLMVTATRQQHERVQHYLSIVDQPPSLISITANFVETSRDPAREYGIDWSGMSGTEISTESVFNEEGINLNQSVSEQPFWAQTALLSNTDMSLKLNFIREDENSQVVQDPTVVTNNNKVVSLRYVTQVPVESASQNSTTVTTNTSDSQISYLEIGLITNIYPTIVEGSLYDLDEGRAVRLYISIVVSARTGDAIINGNPFPVVTSRTYQYAVTVPDGYTLAIGGLREERRGKISSKVPVLGSIPLLGYAFRSERETVDRNNLIAFITPKILNYRAPELNRAREGGLPTYDESVSDLKHQPYTAGPHSR
jgi:Flp pilus assembly secretin CpaC